MCEMFLSDRPSLKTIQVKGDMILRPETKDGMFSSAPLKFTVVNVVFLVVIVTRSRAKQSKLSVW